MTLEEMNHKMLVQVLENQLVLLVSDEYNHEGIPEAYNATSDLLFEIKE